MNSPKKPLTFAKAMLLAEQRLRTQGERVTSPRTLVLAMLLVSDCASTQDDVSKALANESREVDRVTVYRVLDWLVDHKLAHRVSSDARSWQFNALDEAEHEHGHFACRECERIFCLDEPELPVTVAMPAGFRAEESELLVRGRCPDCAS